MSGIWSAAGLGVEALGLALLHSLWQGAALVVVLAAALAARRRAGPGSRYRLLLVALLLLAALPAATVAIAAVPGLAGGVGAPGVRPPTPGAPAPSPGAAGPGSVPAATGTEDAGPSGQVLPPRRPITAGALLSLLPALLRPALPWLAAAWAVGVSVLGLRFAAGWLLTRRLRSRGVPPPTPIAVAVAAAARLQGLADLEPLLTSDLDTPAVVGWLHPRLLLPAAAVARLEESELVAVLAHEVAHLRRRDPGTAALQHLVEILLFFHPVAWWIRRRLDLEREHCCDDAAVEATGDPAAYVRALLRLEELRAPRAVPGLAAAGASLLGRARRLLVRDPGRPRGRRVCRRITAVALAATAVAALVAGARLSAAVAESPRAPSASGEVAWGRLLDVWRLPVARLLELLLEDADDPAAVLAASPDPKMRRRAALLLGVRAAPGAAQALTTALEDPDAMVRAKAATGLALAPHPLAVPALTRRLREDEDSFVREKSALALGLTGDPRATPALTAAAAGDPSPFVREKAVVALGLLGGPSARAAVRRALSDPDPQVRDKAAALLRRFGSGSAAPGAGRS